MTDFVHQQNRRLDAERHVLSVLLFDPTVLPRCRAELDSDAFLGGQHRAIWDAICDLDDQGEKIQAGRVVDRAAFKWKGLERAYVRSMLEDGEYDRDVEPWIAELKRHSLNSRLALGLAHLAQRAHDNDGDPDAIAADTDALLRSFSSQQTAKVRTAKQVAAGLIEEIDRMNKTGEARDLATGVGVWDHLFRTLRTSLSVIGAAPGVGKTHLAVQMAERMGQDGEKPLYVSAEMPDVDLLAMVAKGKRDFDDDVLYRPAKADACLKAAEAIHLAGQMPLLFTTETNGELLLSLMRDLVRQGRITSVFIDMLQRLVLPSSWGRTLDEQLGEFTKRVKQFALTMRCPVFMLSSFNRSAEDNARPTRKSLRGSGNIESDADNILLLHRLQGEEVEFIAEKGRAKQDRGIVLMRRDFEHGRFVEAQEGDAWRDHQRQYGQGRFG